MNMQAKLASALAERQAQHLYRCRKVTTSAQGVELGVAGDNKLNFCSNDYLGLANHPLIVDAFKRAADRYGVGSGASHLVCGHSAEHHLLEEELAVFTGRERALLFSTGYMANIGCVNALMGRRDAVFEDRLNHASLLDAGLSSGAQFQRFAHNDLADLKRRLNKTEAHRRLILVDGVFSMDGDFAPLVELAQMAADHEAWLMVDDAHGFAVLGETGAGVSEHFGLSQQQLPVLMCTLGKAAGTFGAFVAGSEALIETLIQEARTYIYTTALPPAVAAAARASLEVIRTESWRREHLRQLIAQFRRGAQQLGLTLMDSQTPIQPLLIGDPAKALQASESLFEKGILISAIRPPTVPKGTARLRITLSAAHSTDQVNHLLSVLSEVI